MKRITLVWVLCLMACMGATTAQAQNLLSNPGFELGLDDEGKIKDWQISPDDVTKATFTVETADKHSGTASAKITYVSGGYDDLYQVVPVTAGKTYTFSFWYNVIAQKVAGSGRVVLVPTFYDNNSTPIPIEPSTYEGTYTLQTWQQYSVDIVAPANAAYVDFRIRLLSRPNVLIDDASITEAGAKQSQTITGLSDMTKKVGDAAFDLSATASTAVTYVSNNTSVATISGSTVTIVGAGTTTITASAAASDTYNAAPDVTATLTVNPATVNAQNLLQCPGFEDDNFADVWTNDFGNLVSVVSDDHYSGTKSCKLITDVGLVSEVYQKIEVTTGKAYTLSIYNKLLNNGGNGTAMLGYAFLDANGSNMADFVSVPLTSTQGTWVKGSLSTDVAPAGAVYIWFDIQSNGDAGTSILFDDASLTLASTTGLWDVVHNNTSLTIIGNPVQGNEAKLTFTQAGEGAVIHVTDLTGKSLIQQVVSTGSTSATLSVANLSKGIYLVKYTDNAGKRATVKMIK